MNKNRKRRRQKRRLRVDRFIALLVILAALIAAILYGFSFLFHLLFPDKPAEKTPAPTPTPAITASPSVEPEEEENSALYDVNSILFCANKKHPLPDNYQPADLVYVNVTQTHGDTTLRKEAADAMVSMFEAAKADGVTLVLGSGFRDQAYQTNLYNMYVAQSGQAYADSISSRPGYSEHQTGLAADIKAPDDGTFLDETFINTPQGQWLYNNAYRFGWILRYPEGKEDITGYSYEPWHYRYVGVETATAMHNIDPNLTFEEYFNIEGGTYIEG